MRKLFLLAAVIAVVTTLGLGFGYAQTAAQGHARVGWNCPWQNQATGYGNTSQNADGWQRPWMGSGYRQGRVSGMRYGAMGPGGCRGYGRGYRGRGPGPQYGSNYQNPAMQSRPR